MLTPQKIKDLVMRDQIGFDWGSLPWDEWGKMTQKNVKDFIDKKNNKNNTDLFPVPPTPTPPPNNNSSIPTWVLPAALTAGTVGAVLYFSKNKKSKLSGMKFGNFKSIGKNVLMEGSNIVLLVGGTVASRKFIDFNKFFANRAPDNKFLNFVVEHQGGVKFGAGLLAACMIPGGKKYSMLKFLAYGVALDGAIQETRVLLNKFGKGSWVPAIGQGGSLLQENAANGTIGNLLEERAANGTIGKGIGYTGPVTTSVGCAEYDY